jgi:hypothetical protein
MLPERLVGCAVGCLGLLGLVGCAASSTRVASSPKSGYDVLVAHDAQGEVTIVPQSGVAFRPGSMETEQVHVEWTTSHDVAPGKMLVWNRDRSRLLASLDASAVDVRHRSGDPFQFSLVPRLGPHAASVAPVVQVADVAASTASEDEVDDDDDAYTPWDETLGRWNRPASLE